MSESLRAKNIVPIYNQVAGVVGSIETAFRGKDGAQSYEEDAVLQNLKDLLE